MSAYRGMAALTVASAAAVFLAACSAGVTSAGVASDAGRSGLARSMVSVGGPIGSFPVPAGATVADKMTNSKEIVLLLGSVTPAQVSRFYTAELPRDGYKISGSTLVAGGTGGTGAVVAMEFSGHGYQGTIGALSSLPVPVPQLRGSKKNVLAVTLTRQ